MFDLAVEDKAQDIEKMKYTYTTLKEYQQYF